MIRVMYGCSFIDVYFEYVICKFTIAIKGSLISTLENIILLTLYELNVQTNFKQKKHSNYSYNM